MYKLLFCSCIVFGAHFFSILKAQTLDTFHFQAFCKEKSEPVMPYLPCLAISYYLHTDVIADKSEWSANEKDILIKECLNLSLAYAQQALFVNPNYALNHHYHIKSKLALNLPQGALDAIIIYLDMSLDNKHRWINEENAIAVFSSNDILNCLASELRYFQESYALSNPLEVEKLHSYLLENYPNAPFTYNLIGEYKRFYKSDENAARYYFKMAEKKMASN